LDFANGVEDWGTSYGDLVTWSTHAGLLAAEQARNLDLLAAAHPAEAARALARAVMLRHALYQVFSAVASAQPVAPRALATLNAALARALARLRLVALQDGAVGWAWAGEADALDRVLWVVARDGADLLTGTERGRVRECAGDDCDRLFVDRSRNRSRRWCEMTHCGMLAKSRRHYARARLRRKPAAAAPTLEDR
jgi:predicted RNA-binding Zn ribbon-like protein